jgi:hypothetical protein
VLAGGVLISLWGLFWVSYRGDEGASAVYISFGGSNVNAQVIGVIALAIGLIAIWVSLRDLRSRRRFVNRNVDRS